MNSIEYVTTRLESLIQMGASKPEIVRQMAKATDGWPYVFGAWGEQCTPANRRRRKRDDHPTSVTACQVLNGDKPTCDGCKWDVPVDMFDCRGYTYWCLKQVGITISGGGCTSQWNTAANWVVKGPISEMPRDRVCCIFVRKGSKMEHTGLYLGDGTTAECSSGVQLKKSVASKWTHYAIPAGLYEDTPTPTPSTDKPTLRKGDKGAYVIELQKDLVGLGYDLGKYGPEKNGVDGSFGQKTEDAVKAFQRTHTGVGGTKLAVDGVVGKNTWWALDNAVAPEPTPEPEPPKEQLYTVTIPHVSLAQAEKLCAMWSEATMEKE